MRVLVCGATGFIGSHLVAALLRRGHRVTACQRRPAVWTRRLPQADWVQADLLRDVDAAAWQSRVAGVDVVVNAVGALTGDLERLQGTAPAALFRTAAQAGARVVQVSALGADRPHPPTAFLATKRAADQALAACGADGAIVYPSLVMGPGGASTDWFSRLALLPVLALPEAGRQPVQPIAIDDLTDLLVALVESREPGLTRVPAVGPEPMPLADLVATLRQRLGRPPARVLPLPGPLARMAARTGEAVGSPFVTRANLTMLASGSSADPADCAAILGRPPRSLGSWLWSLARPPVAAARAADQWLRPLALVLLTALWVFSGLTSGWLAAERGFELLTAAGVAPAVAPWLLHIGAGLDVALGLALAWRPIRRPVLWAQLALMLGYTGLIAWLLPAQWLEPFGPVTKNLPLAVLYLWLLLGEEMRR